MRAWAVVSVALFVAACGAEEENTQPRFEAGELAIEADLSRGVFSVRRGGRTAFENATADVLFSTGREPRAIAFSSGCAKSTGAAGEIVCRGTELELRLNFELAENGEYVVLSLSAQNISASPLTVLRLAPLVVDAKNSGKLFPGARAADFSILENGRFIVFDQSAQLVRGDVEAFPLAEALPIGVRGNSVSNWTQVVAEDGGEKRALVAGYLSAEKAIPTLGIAAGAGGEFDSYAAESPLIFHGKILAPGDSVSAEKLYLEVLPEDPLAGLERYADILAKYRNTVVWQKRAPGRDVPNGWNSWTGSSFTGGYGQAIDEALIAENLEIFDRELKPFGMSWFQIDDGWQERTGDWTWKNDEFPAGGDSLAAEINSRGLKPGLWIAPFLVEPESSLAAAHPEWRMPKEDSFVGALGKDGETLDLTNPGVHEFLRETMTRVKDDAFRWVKADFTYWAMLGKPLADPSLTNVEAYKKGWQTIREALGPEVFLLGIGIVGANAGIADGMRTTLDNGPRWEESSPENTGGGQSFKATVRTGSRRWFYGNRAWVNHGDLIFFRSWTNDEEPALTFEESRSFAAWIGLTGSIVKLGDKLPDLAAKTGALEVVRRLLPIYPEPGARPVDVLTRDYPEMFVNRISAPAGEWEVVGLFHWGRNRDLSARPVVELPDDQPRTHLVNCAAECLVFEHWTETFLGTKSGMFEVSVPPHDSRVLALRAKTGVPQLLGTNRHLLQGAVELGALSFDPATKILRGSARRSPGTIAAPYTMRLYFHVPAGFAFESASVAGEERVQAEQTNEVLRVEIEWSSAEGFADFELKFR